MAIILMVISGYSIGGCRCLLMAIILVAIGGYWWLFYWWTLMLVNGYCISGY
jgi:hypothetical protein